MESLLVLSKDIQLDDHTIKFYVNENDTCVGAWIRAGNIWEHFIIPYFKQYVKENSTVIDAGANIGTHSVYLGKLFPNCQIKSFEPVPWIHDILDKNIAINNITNCTTYKVGLGATFDKSYSSAGVNDIEKQQNFAAFSLACIKENDRCQEVPIIPLDSYNFQNVSLIKIDTEGYEIDILKGAMETIRTWKPTLIVELFPPAMTKFNELFWPEFQELGYSCEPASPHCDYLFTIK